jgi:cold shock CspA family protein
MLRYRGTVKWYSRARAYGFIIHPHDTPPGSPGDLFFHRKEFKANVFPEAGVCVEYSVRLVEGRFRAVDCVLLHAAVGQPTRLRPQDVIES